MLWVYMPRDSKSLNTCLSLLLYCTRRKYLCIEYVLWKACTYKLNDNKVNNSILKIKDMKINFTLEDIVLVNFKSTCHKLESLRKQTLN